jgi:hypothetical protein
MKTGISHFFYLCPEARDGSKSKEQTEQKGNVEVRDMSLVCGRKIGSEVPFFSHFCS